MNDIPWTHGPRALGDEPSLWTLLSADAPPTEVEHRAFCAAARAFLEGFLERHGMSGAARPEPPESAGHDRGYPSEPAATGSASLDSPDAYVRGDFFGDRTEELILDPPAFAERPELVAALVRQAQEFLSQPRWSHWRFIVPLRDLSEGGILAVYAEAVFARRELSLDELERHVSRLVLRDAAEREGEETVRRARVERLSPLVRAALIPFLAAGDWARVLHTERGEPGYTLVWVLHRFAPGEGLDDLDLEPESGYQEVMPIGERGDFEDAFGGADRERLLLVCWEVPTARGRRLSLSLGERSSELGF